jgi:hypothetical protein
MKLKVGDKVKLLAPIKAVYKSDDWNRGIYQVISVNPRVGFNRGGELKSYNFHKCKPDGSFTKFFGGYSTDAFDALIELGQVEIIA